MQNYIQLRDPITTAASASRRMSSPPTTLCARTHYNDVTNITVRVKTKTPAVRHTCQNRRNGHDLTAARTVNPERCHSPQPKELRLTGSENGCVLSTSRVPVRPRLRQNPDDETAAARTKKRNSY